MDDKIKELLRVEVLLNNLLQVKLFKENPTFEERKEEHRRSLAEFLADKVEEFENNVEDNIKDIKEKIKELRINKEFDEDSSENSEKTEELSKKFANRIIENVEEFIDAGFNQGRIALEFYSAAIAISITCFNNIEEAEKSATAIFNMAMEIAKKAYKENGEEV